MVELQPNGGRTAVYELIEETDGSPPLPLPQSNGRPRTVVDRPAYRRSESSDESSATSQRNNSLLVYAGRVTIGLLLFVLMSGSVSLSKLSLVALSNKLSVWNMGSQSMNLTSDQPKVCCYCTARN